MGAAFGGGAAAQVFGGRGAGNLLTRATAVCAGIFMLTKALRSRTCRRPVTGRLRSRRARRWKRRRSRRRRGPLGRRRAPPPEASRRQRYGDWGSSAQFQRARARGGDEAPGRRVAGARALEVTGAGAPAHEMPARKEPAGNEEAPARGRAIALDLGLLFAAKAALGAYVLATGFTHVSDDDYARTVIAQQFAHHPGLDPSGTSWLPFPFWVTGGAMLLFGRSLTTARAVACVLGVVSVAAPYAALRAVGCRRAIAVAGVLVAATLPWSAWLGVATVPEAPTACLIAAGAIAVTSVRGRVAASVALLAASLSRYEAWPVCAVFAAACVFAARRRGAHARGATTAAAGVSLVGPLAWMLWNARGRTGACSTSSRALCLQPTRQRDRRGRHSARRQARRVPGRARVERRLPFSRSRSSARSRFPSTRRCDRRWLTPPFCAAADARVPRLRRRARRAHRTHHPERAGPSRSQIVALFALDSPSPRHCVTLARRSGGREPAAGARAPRARAARGRGVDRAAPRPAPRDVPATSAQETRDAQIARGRALTAAEPAGTWEVTPCAYEHFALLAASGQPERFTVLPASRAPVTPACPRVEAEAPSLH